MNRLARYMLLATVFLSLAGIRDASLLLIAAPLAALAVPLAVRPHAFVNLAARLAGASIYGRRVYYEDVAGKRVAVIVERSGDRFRVAAGMLLEPPRLRPGVYREQIPVYVMKAASIAATLSSMNVVVYTGVARQVDKARLLRLLRMMASRRKGSTLESQAQMLEESGPVVAVTMWALVYAEGETLREAVDRLKRSYESIWGAYLAAGFSPRPAGYIELSKMIETLLTGPEKK